MSAIETVVVHNDLSKLTPAQRWDYYRYRCESIGLNPAARPFQYIVSSPDNDKLRDALLSGDDEAKQYAELLPRGFHIVTR